jgi:cytoskeletal protein CcmA (bactofilin family)
MVFNAHLDHYGLDINLISLFHIFSTYFKDLLSNNKLYDILMEDESNQELDGIPANDNGCILVGEGVSLEGRIANAKDTNIAGTYNGSINSDSLYVSKNGNLTGDIKTQNVTIDGKFTGDVRTENSLVVNSTALAKGNFEYSILEVKFGATIEGMVKHSGAISPIAPAEKSLTHEEQPILDTDISDNHLEVED